MTRKLFEWIPATEKDRPKKNGMYFVIVKSHLYVDGIGDYIEFHDGDFLINGHPANEKVIEYLREADPLVWPGEQEIGEAFLDWFIKEEKINGGISESLVWETAINWVKQQMENMKLLILILLLPLAGLTQINKKPMVVDSAFYKAQQKSYKDRWGQSSLGDTSFRFTQDSAHPSWITFDSAGRTTLFAGTASVATASFWSPVFVFRDSMTVYYENNQKHVWTIHVSQDTIVLRTPPKKIIVGHTSYSSLYLNGNWVLLMDPNPVR